MKKKSEEDDLLVSIVLVGHTLQQGYVVAFQHDPPWETNEETQETMSEKSRRRDGKRYLVSVHF